MSDIRTGSPPPDLYFLSDLHLSAGCSKESRRTSRLETFYYDYEFSNFVDRLIVESSLRQRETIVILNGDIFDFLAVTKIPTPDEIEQLGITLTRHEKKFGMESEPIKDAWKMRHIIRGHPEFMAALLRLADAGVSVRLHRGNHDLELFWPEVQDAFYDEIAKLAYLERAPDVIPENLRRLITFHDWFYHEPGRIWVEHGHQYEASNSLSYQLWPVLTTRSDKTPTLDLPTGSLFVRYVYNRMRIIDPYSTQVFSLEKYLDIISTSNALELAKALFVHFPFFTRALKRARIFELGGMGGSAAKHRQRLAQMSEESGLGDNLGRIDALRRFPIGVTKYTLFRQMMRPIVRNFVGLIVVFLASIGGWMLLFSLIQNTHWLAGSVLGKASLMAVLAVATIVGLFAAGTWFSRRYGRVKDTLNEDLVAHAEAISRILDVRLIVFGHSHGVDRRLLSNGHTLYGNSGTWIAVRGAWDQLRPFGRQFTFLRVRDDDIEALRWNDWAARIEPVTLFEHYEPTVIEKLIGEGTKTRDEKP